jgi:hypothetical protein
MSAYIAEAKSLHDGDTDAQTTETTETTETSDDCWCRWRSLPCFDCYEGGTNA